MADVGPPVIPLIGREAELDRVIRTLGAPEGRLVTLTGPPGVGKSRLAAEAAARLTDRFPLGVVTVDMAAIGQASLVDELSRLWGVRGPAAVPLIERLIARLSGGAALVVLDACEAVREVGGTVAELLRRCPRLRVLATSRERLRLGMEKAIAVPPLAMPQPLPPAHSSGSVVEPAMIAAPAVELFVRRARLVVPGFTVNPANARTVAELCVHLEGLPLALEVAAACLRHLELAELSSRLRSVGTLSTTEAAAGRHRTLRSTIESSIRLLDSVERLVFRRLAGFPADWSMAAAEGVVGDAGVDVVVIVQSLVDKSLVRRIRRADGTDGHTFLDSIREFARDELADAGEVELVANRHRDYYAGLAARAEESVGTLDEGLCWLWFGDEHVNVRVALATARATGDLLAALPLASVLGWFWYTRGQLAVRDSEIELVIRDAEQVAGADMEPLLGGAFLAAGVVAFGRRDHVRAGTYLREAVRLSDRAGEWRRSASAHAFLGHLARIQGSPGAARREHTVALELYGSLHNDRGVAWARHDLALVCLSADAVDEAYRLMSSARQFFRVDSRADHWPLAWIESGLGEIAARKGDLPAAVRLLSAALDVFVADGDLPRMTHCVQWLAMVAHARAEHHRAVRLLAASVAWRTTANPETPADIARAERVRSAAIAALGSAAVDREWTNGHRLDATAVVRLAADPGDPVTATGSPLTARQRQVANLVAQGLTNRQIAARLGIADRTVDVHLTQIMARLAVHNRAAVAAFAATSPAAQADRQHRHK